MNMLHRTDGSARAGDATVERASRAAPTHRAMLERRRGNRLLSAWKAARGDLAFPSFAALEAAADAELMRHSLLLRVGLKGALTIERFGPPAPPAAAKDGAVSPPVITPLVVTWVLAVAGSALRRRTPVTESDEVRIGNRRLCYRCAVVPVASDGAEVDSLVGVLGYRWS
jgi:hypothetical protein